MVFFFFQGSTQQNADNFCGRHQQTSRSWFLTYLHVVFVIIGGADNDNARAMQWLPKYLPPNIKMVFSCTSGEMVNFLRCRFFEVVNVPEFDLDMRTQV